MKSDSAQVEQVTAVIGEQFVIVLEENPTTGYLWKPELDSSYLDHLGREHRRTGEAIGGGGISLFSFLPRKVGFTLIQFRLSRPWESQAIMVVRYQVRILPRPN